MFIGPFLSLLTAIKLVYDRYEFNEADIKVYKLLHNEKFFNVKNIKYDEIQSLNFDIEDRDNTNIRSKSPKTKIYF